jgi:hypothetical protein
MGSIITSSTDGTVRISTPTQRPETMAVVSSQVGEVTGVSKCGFSQHYNTVLLFMLEQCSFYDYFALLLPL